MEELIKVLNERNWEYEVHPNGMISFILSNEEKFISNDLEAEFVLNEIFNLW